MGEVPEERKDWLEEAWATVRPWLEQAALPAAILLALVTVHFYTHRYVGRDGGTTLRGETLRKAGMIELPMEDVVLLEEDALDRIRRRIESRPSVRRVVSLERVFPSSVRVAVEMREPWIGASRPDGVAVLDRDRMTMHPAAPRPPSTRTGLVIKGIRGRLPPPGREARQPEVVEAFAMAEVVMAREELRGRIQEIDVTNHRRRIDAGRPEIILRTHAGCEIHWGRMDGAEELAVEAKIENLRAVLKRHPDLRGIEYVKIYIKDRPTIRRHRGSDRLASGSP